MARVHPSPGCCELNRFALPFLRLVFLRVHVHHRKILPAYPTFHVVDPTSTPVAPFPASTSMRYRRASWKPPNHCTAHPCPYPCHPLTFVPCQSVPLICRVGAECRNEISCIFVQDLARGGTGILNQSGSVYGFGGGSPPTCVLYLSHLTAPIRLLIYIFSFQDMSTICGIMDFHMLPRTNINIQTLIQFGVVFEEFRASFLPNLLIPFFPDTGIRTHDMKTSLSSSLSPSFIDWTSRYAGLKAKRWMSHLVRVDLYRFCGQIHG